MSLWGCDCPLPALAACHQRGMVCSRLSLFSPLFPARAWWCLRLGLAFRVVDIPQHTSVFGYFDHEARKSQEVRAFGKRTKQHQRALRDAWLVGRRGRGGVLKNRDVILPTKVCLVKAMVFPVVMYGCESWTIKKADSQRIDACELWCWRRLLSIPWTVRRSNQSTLKEIHLNVHWKD